MSRFVPFLTALESSSRSKVRSASLVTSYVSKAVLGIYTSTRRFLSGLSALIRNESLVTLKGTSLRGFSEP